MSIYARQDRKINAVVFNGTPYGSVIVDNRVILAPLFNFGISADGESCTVSPGRDHYEGELEIPATYAGLPVRLLSGFEGQNLEKVTALSGTAFTSDYCFSECTDLQEIYGITGAGRYAFQNCYNLYKIGATMYHLSEGSFYGCTALSEITLDVLGAIPLNCFYGCTNLTTVYFTGTEFEWNEILIQDGNEALKNATIIFHEHSWGENTITKYPECGIAGQSQQVCTGCGAINIEAIPATGHQWGDWDVKVEATCTTNGSQKRYCPQCDTYETRNIPATGHDLGEWYTTIEPTDTEKGQKRRDCLREGCDYYEVADIPMLIKPLDYTLLTDGTYSVRATEGVVLTGVIEIPSTYKGKAVTQIASNGFRNQNEITLVIIPEGVKSIGSAAFNYCPNLVSLVIPKSVTDLEDSIVTYFTDNTSFTTVYYGGTESDWANITIGFNNDLLKKATFYYYSETEPIAEGNYWHLVNGEPFAWYDCGDNHTWRDWVIIEEATCFTEGLKSHICDKCGHIEEKTIPNTHSFGEWYVHTEPTCTNAGVKRKDCDCGEYETEIIEKLDHVSSDWIIDKEATEDEMGTKHTECIHCGVVLKEVTFSNLDFTRPSSYNLFRISNSRPNEQTNTYAIWASNAGTNYPIKVDKVTILPKLTFSGDKIHHIGESAFREAKANSGSGGFKIGIPYTIETIDRNAFEESYVEEVIFEEYSKLKKIDYKAFYGCWALKKITLPPSVEWICEGAFNGTAFEEIHISKNVITIEPRVFADMPSNCTIYVEAESKPEGWADDWCDETINVVWGHKDCNYGHLYGGWTTTARPTCTRFGSMQRTCSICGDIEIALIDPLGHDYEEVGTDPTCTEAGYKTYTCSRCGHSYTEELEALGHDYKITKQSVQKCGKDGYIIHTCSRCDHSYTEILPPEHDGCSYVITTIPPTCEDEGYDLYACENCNHSYQANFKEARGHNPSDWIIDVYPTFVSEGSKHKKCLRCGEILETATIPMLTTYWDFTLLDDGTYSVKPLEDVQLPSEIDIPSEHNGIAVTRIENSAFEGYWNTLLGTITKVNIPSSITHIGAYAFQDCRGLTEITIPIGVIYVGRQAFYECGEDGIIIYCEAPSQPSGWHSEWAASTGSGNTVIWTPNCSHGHTWGEWHVPHPATCEVPGMRARICTVCGEAEETEIIPAAGHDWGIDVTVVEPTCTEQGYTIYPCNNCAETHYDDYVPALGHNIVDGVCTRCGYSNKMDIYYGVSAIPERYNSSFILGLEHQVVSSKHLESITVEPLAGEYIYYCAPTSFGDCAFAYNNFVGGFTLIIEGLALTNAGGKTEAYNIYKSNQANLGANGAITITIKEMG